MELSELPSVFKRSFRASRNAMRRAEERRRASDFHRWRKRVKNLWYQLRLAEHLIADASDEVTGFKELETALGEEHNLVVLRTRLARDKGLRYVRSEVEQIITLSTVLQDEVRQKVLALGTHLYAASPKEFAKDLRRRLKPQGSRRKQASPVPRRA